MLPLTLSRRQAALFAGLLCVILATRLWQASPGLSQDFAVNWIAAKALRAGASIYDWPALNRLALAELGPAYGWLFTSFFSGYIGPPTNALWHVPFTFLPFAWGAWFFRGLTAAAGVTGMALAARALPSRQERWLGFGLGLFMWWAGEAFRLDMFLGQMNGWVLLGLGLAVWGAARGRWAWAGVGAGLAALLKISPAIFLVYLAVRRRWSALLIAGAVMLGLLAASALVGGPGNVIEFFTRVLPTMGVSSMTAHNQSLPAYACRLFSANNDFGTLAPPLAGCALWAAPVWLLGYAAVEWLARRSGAPRALAMSLLIPVALLAGPHTWDHYVTWASLVFVQLADRRLWAPPLRWPILALAVSGLLTLMPALVFTDTAVETYGLAARLLSGLNTMGLIGLFGTGLALMARAQFQNAAHIR
jgi:hypothetical protein